MMKFAIFTANDAQKATGLTKATVYRYLHEFTEKVGSRFLLSPPEMTKFKAFVRKKKKENRTHFLAWKRSA